MPTAGLLNRPLMTLIFVLDRLQRLEALAELHVRALALGPPVIAVDAVAHEHHGKALRERACCAARRRRCRRGRASPQTGSDSSHGSAIVTPTPRRNVRREIRPRSISRAAVFMFHAIYRSAARSARSSRPRLFRNCGLVTMLSIRRIEPIIVLPRASRASLRSVSSSESIRLRPRA